MGGVIEIILIFIIIGVIIYLLHLYHALDLERRVAKYTISSKVQEEEPLLVKCFNILKKLINKISKVLSRSEVLTKYGRHYEKYISFEEKDQKSGIDYVSFKLVLAIFILILSLVTYVFQPIKINLFMVLIIFLISFFIPDIVLYFSFNKRRKQIEDDLLEAIIIMNSAFQSGRNIMQAIEVVKEEIDGPIKDEFQKIYLDITYGLSLDVVFNRFYERVKLEDAKVIATSLTMLNKTGGDIVKVFNILEKSIMDRKTLNNELKSLTASSQVLFKMLVVLPLIFVMLIVILNPTYFNVLFKTPIGLLILGLIVVLYISYILIIRKVLKVEI